MIRQAACSVATLTGSPASRPGNSHQPGQPHGLAGHILIAGRHSCITENGAHAVSQTTVSGTRPRRSGRHRGKRAFGCQKPVPLSSCRETDSDGLWHGLVEGAAIGGGYKYFCLSQLNDGARRGRLIDPSSDDGTTAQNLRVSHRRSWA